MFTRLLVPLDGSRLAESSLPAVMEFAQRLDARVTLYHAVERAAPATVHGDRHLTGPSEAESYLGGVTAWLAERGVRANLRVDADSGDVAAGIASAAAAERADLIVLCTHGWSGLRGLLFGRVAQQVLQRGKVPVLLVHPTPAGRSQPFACTRILVPLDGSETAEVALPAASELATACRAEILLAMVVPTVETISGERAAATRLMPSAAAALLDSEADEARRYLDAVAARLRASGQSPVLHVGRGEPVRALLDAAARADTDLIVMATHGRSGVSAMWAGSVASRIVGHSTRPVLLVRIR